MIWSVREIKDAYHGAERIAEIYAGDALVWSNWRLFTGILAELLVWSCAVADLTDAIDIAFSAKAAIDGNTSAGLSDVGQTGFSAEADITAIIKAFSWAYVLTGFVADVGLIEGSGSAVTADAVPAAYEMAAELGSQAVAATTDGVITALTAPVEIEAETAAVASDTVMASGSVVMEITAGVNADAIYPRWTLIDNVLYLHKAARIEKDGSTLYIDMTEWQSPVEDGETLTLYQAYDITESGDVLEVH